MIIGKPEVTRRGDLYRYSVDVSGREMWFEAPHPMSESSDAAATAMLLPAMATGEDITVEGPISEQLAFALDGPVQTIAKALLPSRRLVSLTAEHFEDVETSGTATGFSAGIDSFSVLADYYFGQGPRITHLLFNNVGSHRGGEDQWRERLEIVKPVAERIGLPLIPVNSNLMSIYDGLRFQATHTLRNTSVAMVLGFSKFFYASTYSYPDCHVGKARDMAYADPFILPLLSTSARALMSVGGEYSRVEKTLQVAEIEESYRSLDICAGGVSSGNCSVCWKCLRTLVTLELGGVLSRYDRVFDLDAYARAREDYVRDLLVSRKPLLREVVAFGRERGAFSTRERVSAKARHGLRMAFRRRTGEAPQ